ncbi:MAG: TraR/DksA family transcriptional regulator [Deltaproteobacteria bacterium]|nr:TraR/DksA family transcriptional regulator [Deltaproteobacteria bacterium]
MTPAKLRHLKDRLTALREEILGKVPQRIEPNRKDDAEVGGDEDEQPLNEMLQSIASNRNRNESAVLLKVDKALRKIAQKPDEYGLCEECGDDLAEARLSAMPFAELCLECQAKRDGSRGPRTRRNLYDFR